MAVLPYSPLRYLKPISSRDRLITRIPPKTKSPKPIVLMADLPERSKISTAKMTEMVRIPDALDSGYVDEVASEEAVSRSKKAEIIVLRDGSLKFNLDFSSEGRESTLNKLVCKYTFSSYCCRVFYTQFLLEDPVFMKNRHWF